MSPKNLMNCLLGMFITAGLVGCSDTIEVNFADMKQARSAGEIERGWLPSWIPDHAIDINDKHNLDTNENIVTFRVTQAEKFPVPPGFLPIEVGALKEPGLHAKWWKLRIDPTSRNQIAYSTAGSTASLVLDKREDVVYYWETGNN